MGNLTLKEQLQALSLGSSSTLSPEANNKKSRRETKTESKKHKPAWLDQAKYGVELLKAYFPLCFKEINEVAPLKIGIKQDLVKVLANRDDVVLGDKACMVSSLSYYVSTLAYHKSVTAGAVRIDLNGESSGVVTEEEARYSNECRQQKLKKKNKSALDAKIA